MNPIRDYAIVVSGSDLGESDRIITFITPGHGRMRAVAKGARRSRKRFLNALEPCTLLKVAVVPSRRDGGLGRLDSADIVESFPAIRASVKRFMFASLCCELSSMWIQEEEAAPAAFELLKWYLEMLCVESQDPMIQTLIFKTKLLTLAGYRQLWDRCIRCEAPSSGRAVRYSTEKGGPFCEMCAGPDRGDRTVSGGVLKSLAFMDNQPLDTMNRLRMNEQAAAEAWGLLSSLHTFHLHRKPKSYAVLQNILKK